MAVRTGRLQDSALIATGIGSMRTVICASPKLLAQHGNPQTVQELQRLPCIVFEGPMSMLAEWRLRDPQGRAPLRVSVVPRLSVNTAEAAVRAALRNVGVTRLLYYQVADAVRAGKLQVILERFERDPVPVNVVHAAHAQMPLKMRSFLDFAVPRLRALLPRPSMPHAIKA